MRGVSEGSIPKAVWTYIREELTMRFTVPSIVRKAITYAILDCLRIGWVQDIPNKAYSSTYDRYHYSWEASNIAEDVHDWFLANGPYGGDVDKTTRRLMLKLWKDEEFSG